MDRFAPARHLSPPELPAPIMRKLSSRAPLWTRGFSPSWSVNFSRTLQRLFQFLERKILGSRDLQDRRLATGAELAGFGNLCCDLNGNHDRAVAVGVNEIVGAHGHAGNANLAAKAFG